MKKILLLIVITICGITAFSQTKTIYLFRHAEKDTTGASAGGMMNSDPSLSPEGKLRAQRMANLVKSNTVMFYTTKYNRTVETAREMVATKTVDAFNMGAAFSSTFVAYDPRKQQQLADEILNSSHNNIVVVGHSNTIPALVNMFIKEKKYSDWPESVYNQYFIVTIKEGKAEAKLMEM